MKIIPSQESTRRHAIIKADDVRGETEKWNRFFDISLRKGVSVTAGIICNTLQNPPEDYVRWLRELRATGQVEFWNHGWDHARWEDEQGTSLKEFRGSGYDHQKTHFEDAQTVMEQVFGEPSRVFGTPFNAVDQDTVQVMQENEDLQLFFSVVGFECSGLQCAPMVLRGEANGTGKPDARAFIEAYSDTEPPFFSSTQFHPNSFQNEHFAEYEKILDFLLAEDWRFLLPAEVLQLGTPMS